MNTERLLLLADKLETVVPADKFSLRGWRRGRTLWVGVDDHALVHGCGTTGCAVGWACAMPEFQDQGLRWNEQMVYPEFEDATSWDAVTFFFEIDEHRALHLFMDSRYPRSATPSQVAARIRALVENGGEVPA